MGSFVADAQSKVRSQVKFPEGYYMTWGGEFENQRRAMKRLMLIVPISILVIYSSSCISLSEQRCQRLSYC